MSRSDELFTDAAAYERLMGRWSRRAGDVFLEWLSPAPDLRWLDIGCGTGVFTEQIARHGSPAAVVGIDPSREQVAFAETRAGLEAAEFRVGDGQDLPFPDESFDVAVMALVIHFVPDPARAVTEMARVLRPGGLGASYVWDHESGGSPTAAVPVAMKAIGLSPPSPPSPHATFLPALEELWRAAGFAGIATRTITIAVEFEDFEEFWHAMTAPVGSSGSAMAEMSPHDRQRLRAVLQERIPVTGEGRVVYEARANAIKGRKG